MLDTKLQTVKNHFGIATLDDWRDVEPNWILQIDGIGRVTLDYIRMNLAAKGVTLKNDATPDYWKKKIAETRMLEVMENEELGEAKDVHVVNPFTILIDSAETQPYTFQGIVTDAAEGSRPLIVPTEWQCLGRHPDGLGDYSIKGHVGRIHIERKSMDDAHGTILGWDERRERFEQELSNLNDVHRGYVVCECSFGQLLKRAPEWGKKTASENSKILSRSVLSWIHKWPKVQWLFCDDRRLAELTVFRVLEKYWKEESGPQ